MGDGNPGSGLGKLSEILDLKAKNKKREIFINHAFQSWIISYIKRTHDLFY